MRPDAILGFDPAPGDPVTLARLSDALRASIRGLVESRAALDALGRSGSVWDGPVGAPIVSLLRRYSLQVSTLEESLIGCLTAVDEWRVHVGERQGEVADLVELVADLAGVAGSEERRTRLIGQAREIGSEHERAARVLGTAFEELSATVEYLGRADAEIASGVDAALLALAAAVEAWVDAEGPELVRTAVALGEVAALTAVISELVGITVSDRVPAAGEGVHDAISQSPAAHRLMRALGRRWLAVDPASLPEATFARRQRSELTDAIAGRLTPRREPGSPEADDGRADDSLC